MSNDTIYPNFLIIGAQKGGTESAVFHLSQHPDIQLLGEQHLFDKQVISDSDIEHYKEKFKSDKSLRGEKTPSYMYLRYAIDRIHKFNPQIKLIIFLREPVSRAFSHYNMALRGKHTFTFEEFIDKESNILLSDISSNNSYPLQRGYYIDHIEYILTKFHRDNIYIAISEEVQEDLNGEYNKLFKFVGVSPHSLQDIRLDIHKRTYTSQMTPEMAEYLHKHYESYNNRLFKFLGREITCWKHN